jgi:hypothetical protein
MAKRLLPLILLLAMSASAQLYTLTFAADSSSDGANAYNTVVMDYAPGQNCLMCTQSSHTYAGTQLLQASNGPSNSCTWSAGGSGNDYVYTGCEVGLAFDDSPQTVTYQGYTTATNWCTRIGFFFSVVSIAAAPQVTRAYSAYQEDRPCTSLGNGSYACEVQAYGAGCPGKCTTSGAKIVIGQPLGYIQCVDLLIAGKCTGQVCKDQTTPGFCSQVN